VTKTGGSYYDLCFKRLTRTNISITPEKIFSSQPIYTAFLEKSKKNLKKSQQSYSYGSIDELDLLQKPPTTLTVPL
jgi:O-phosphoseryl-tRNA(Cys) synthetase